MTEHTRNKSPLDGRIGAADNSHGPVRIQDALSRLPIKPRPDALTTAAKENCKWCHDKQWFGYHVNHGEPHFGEVYPCLYCNSGNDPEALHRLSGLNEGEQKWRLADLDVEGRPSIAHLEAECRQLIQGKRHILTVWGAYGNGKTLALQAVVNELAERRVPAMYYTTKQMLDHLRAAYHNSAADGSEGVDARLQRLADVPCLVLDEFDKVSPTTWAMEQLTDLIDRRHRGSEAGTHATLIAMNTDPEQLEPWIASRLMAGCNRVVHVDGGDLRPFVGIDEDSGKHAQESHA
jgi:DNA replication protein DnaC